MIVAGNEIRKADGTPLSVVVLFSEVTVGRLLALKVRGEPMWQEWLLLAGQWSRQGEPTGVWVTLTPDLEKREEASRHGGTLPADTQPPPPGGRV